MTATVEERALRAAILAEPGDDTARLVYADWLQEQGREERAEFIRVQVALAAPFRHPCRACRKPIRSDRIADGCPCNSPRGVNHGIVPAYVCTCPECDPEQTGSVRARPAEVEQLRRRERVALAAFWRDWVLMPESYITASYPTAVGNSDPDVQVDASTYRFRRGFIQEVESPAADWLAHGDTVRAAHPVERVTLTTPFEWDGDEDGAWLVGDPKQTHVPWTDIRAEASPEEHDRRHLFPALLRLRWPRITFTLPA